MCELNLYIIRLVDFYNNDFLIKFKEISMNRTIVHKNIFIFLLLLYLIDIHLILCWVNHIKRIQKLKITLMYSTSIELVVVPFPSRTRTKPYRTRTVLDPTSTVLDCTRPYSTILFTVLFSVLFYVLSPYF